MLQQEARPPATMAPATEAFRRATPTLNSLPRVAILRAESGPSPAGARMTKITYEIVEHDGGWAYKVNGVLSEPYPSHDEARKAAQRAAKEQIVPGETTG